MKNKLLMSLLLLSFFLFFGCSEPATQEELGIVEDLPEEEIVPTTNIIKFSSNEKVYLIAGDTVTLVNCGTAAFGPVIVEEIKDYEYKIEKLVITNTTKKYIGGCKDIIINFPNIKKMHIYDIWRDTKEYDDMLRWIQPGKVVYYENETYNDTERV